VASVKHDPEFRAKYIAHKRAVLAKTAPKRKAEARQKAVVNQAEPK
jgi:hypothetical protein